MDAKADGAQRKTGRKRRRNAPVLAALDLGTNNCRLLIAEPTRRGNLRIVDSFSRIVRLGEGVAATGSLSPAAMDRTVAALRVCAQRLKSRGVQYVRAIATEACRRASNTEELVERVLRETGIELFVISVEEEARLAALGCSPLIDTEGEGAIIFDIGGGSTEVIWMRRDRDGEMRVAVAASEPVGVVVLSEIWGGAVDRKAFNQMHAELRERFRSVKAMMNAVAPFDSEAHHLLGTSGTVTTLAGVSLGLPRYNRTRVDGSWHDCRDLAGVINRLVESDLETRASMGCVGRDRADLMIPGCAIYAAVQEQWPCKRLRVADRGLREGLLRDLMAEHRA